ncbi:MAG TPA: CPBP family intramembrane glutamic endopeptidase [Anaerolineae bacterium]|nr:CPBP family intramembrane glutamic endopeptidase [Anaerolineae bacterium]
MTERRLRLPTRNVVAALAIALLVLAAGYFFAVSQLPLGVAFATYAFILAEARVRLRNYIRGFRGAAIVTRLIRSAVFFVPLPFLGFPSAQPQAWGIVGGFVYGAALQLSQVSDLRLTLSRDFLKLLPPLSAEDKFRDTFHPILIASAQEYFYRGVILYVLIPYIQLWAIVVSTVFFVFEHVMHFNASRRWDRLDLLFQMLLSLGLSTLFYFSQALLGSLLGHMAYNFPSLIQALRRSSQTQ